MFGGTENRYFLLAVLDQSAGKYCRADEWQLHEVHVFVCTGPSGCLTAGKDDFIRVNWRLR